MAYGKDLKFYESLGPDSKVMRSRPELDECTLSWYETFWMLNSTRPTGFDGLLAIPISEVEAYCRLTGVFMEEQHSFLRMIHRIDQGFLKLVHERKRMTLPEVS